MLAYRMLAYKDGSHVRLVSRNGVDHTRHFHDIALAISKLSARTLVIDGEVAVFDQQLRSLRVVARALPERRRHVARC